MSANVYYSSHIALGVAWHTTATFHRLHVTILLPWASVQIGLFRRPNVKTRRLHEYEAWSLEQTDKGRRR